MKAVFIGHHLSYHIKFIVCSCWASKVGQVFYYDVYTGKVFFVCITFITNCSTSFTKITIIKLFYTSPQIHFRTSWKKQLLLNVLWQIFILTTQIQGLLKVVYVCKLQQLNSPILFFKNVDDHLSILYMHIYPKTILLCKLGLIFVHQNVVIVNYNALRQTISFLLGFSETFISLSS